MNKIILPLLFIFSCYCYTQEKEPFSAQNAYLQELIGSFEDNSFNSFDIDNKEWRIDAVEKLTLSSNKQEISFLKTAMVLQMLKYKLGDRIFFAAIEKYKKQISDEAKQANILDFQYFLEDESNEELTFFFNDWFKSKGHPSYEIAWFQNEENNVSFTIKQNQSDESVSFFELPLPVKLIGDNGEIQLIRLEISENNQSFNARIPFKILSVEIDPDVQLITKDNKVTEGIDQELLYNEISLFPNPAVNFLTVQNNSVATIEKVSIYNMLGKLILEENNTTSKIDLKSLTSGIHLVKVETSHGTIHKTVLKK